MISTKMYILYLNLYIPMYFGDTGFLASEVKDHQDLEY